MDQPRLTVGFFRMLLASGSAAGVDRAALLAAAGLGEADLIDPDRWVPLAAQLAVGRVIIDARPGQNLGLLSLRHAGPGMLGALGYALAHCPTLGDALRTFMRYQRLLTNATTWQLVGEVLTVEPHPALAALGHPVENMIGLWVVLGRALTGTRWVPRAVEFRHAPQGDPAEHAALFGVAPRFEAEENRLWLPAGALGLPVKGAQVALQPGLRALLDSRMDAAPSGETTQAVEASLRQQLPQGIADKARVAKALGVSVRTLGRRLRAEGTSFQAVLDTVRASLARHWLQHSSMAVYEVAFLLGYSEASTFHRAFRRWTGQAPAVWRAAQ